MKKLVWTGMSGITFERVILNIYVFKAKVEIWYLLITDL